MASASKAAAFAALIRVFTLTFGLYQVDWTPVIWVLAVLSLVVGSVLAIIQTDVKRMLAYSSISHAGFVLVAVEQASHSGTSAALFYLAGYSFMVLGSFGVVGIFGRRGDGHHSLADYTGVAAREPALAFVLTVFLLAQAGVPLTVGFVAKFEVIMSAVEGGSWPLALIAMVSAVISAFLYLKIVIAMYVSDETADESAPRPARLAVPWGTKLGLGLAFVFVVGVGIIPGPITNLAHHAVPHIIAVTR
jgi:NADH-quinone oxidoreductase subunit N